MRRYQDAVLRRQRLSEAKARHARDASPPFVPDLSGSTTSRALAVGHRGGGNGNGGAKSPRDVFDKLYEDSAGTEARRQALAAKVLAAEKALHPFAPTPVAKPRPASPILLDGPSSEVGVGGGGDCEGVDRNRVLFLDAQRRKQRQEVSVVVAVVRCCCMLLWLLLERVKYCVWTGQDPCLRWVGGVHCNNFNRPHRMPARVLPSARTRP